MDKELTGMQWVHLSQQTYTVRKEHLKVSSCQIELDMWEYRLLRFAPIGKGILAPMRILSFDIECLPRLIPDLQGEP